MMALWTTAGLFALAFGTAMSLTWRRYAAEPVRVAAKVEGPTCYPRVRR